MNWIGISVMIGFVLLFIGFMLWARKECKTLGKNKK